MIPATNMSSIIQALCDGEAHLGSLNPFSFLVASQRECAEAKLIWDTHGDIKFSGIVITKDTSSISSLSDLRGKSLCIPSFTSQSAWILPSLEIQADFGDPYTFLGQIIDTGDHTQVRQSVYDGECDAGTTYYGALDATDLPGVNQNLKQSLYQAQSRNKILVLGK